MGPDVYNQMLPEVHILSREGHIFAVKYFWNVSTGAFVFGNIMISTLIGGLRSK